MNNDDGTIKERSRSTKLYKNTLAVYEGLLAESSMRNVGDDRVDSKVAGVEVRVFEGSIGAVFNTVKVPISLYSSIRRNLLEHGCITILRAGTGSVPSMVALHQSPADVPWHGKQEASRKRLTEDVDVAMLRDRIEAIESGNVGGIYLTEAFRNHEDRLLALEKELQDGVSDKVIEI